MYVANLIVPRPKTMIPGLLVPREIEERVSHKMRGRSIGQVVEMDILSVPLNLIEPQDNPIKTSGRFNIDIGSKYP